MGSMQERERKKIKKGKIMPGSIFLTSMFKLQQLVGFQNSDRDKFNIHFLGLTLCDPSAALCSCSLLFHSQAPLQFLFSHTAIQCSRFYDCFPWLPDLFSNILSVSDLDIYTSTFLPKCLFEEFDLHSSSSIAYFDSVSFRHVKFSMSQAYKYKSRFECHSEIQMKLVMGQEKAQR